MKELLILSMVGGLLIGLVSMFLLWLYYLKSNNPSVVDIGFGANVSLIIFWYWYVLPVNHLSTIIISSLGVIWGLRLSWYLGKRNLSGHMDGRYIDMQRRWDKQVQPKKFLGFFQAQAVLDFLLSLPFFWILYYQQELSWSSSVWVAIALFAIVGESVADYQLKRFKKSNEGKAKVLNQGLWKYSRHPNYFFEILFWIAVSVLVAGLPWGWVFFLIPILMFHFIWNVTGIPETELQNLRSKKQAYEKYQKSTSVLVPWPPKLES